MIRSVLFVKTVFLLFFLQDIGNVMLLKAGLPALVQPFSSLKEAMVLAVVLVFAALYLPTLRMGIGRATALLALAGTFLIGFLRGADAFPLDGVVFEFRTLALPLVLYAWGVAFATAGSAAQQRVERIVDFYVKACVVFAVSGILDWLFLGEAFWTWVDVGSINRAKGYIATTSGALPDNMYSYFFGRRALGLAFNPLNLAYMLIPAMVFAWYRKRLWAMLVSVVATVLTFSRVPIAATIVSVILASMGPALRVIAAGIGAIGAVALLVLIMDVLLADPSASQHFAHLLEGLAYQIGNPFGEGIGAAGVYAGNYSVLSLESGVLNTANQIGSVGLTLYVLAFLPGIRRHSPLSRELRLTAGILAITAFLAPQIFVAKSTFAFFFFLGANAAFGERVTNPNAGSPERTSRGGTIPAPS